MPIEQARFFCVQCRQSRLFTRQGTNHLVHILICLFLCGLWIPVYLIILMSEGGKPYYCSQCGYNGTITMLSNPPGAPRRPPPPKSKFGRWAEANRIPLTVAIIFAVVIALVGFTILLSRVKTNSSVRTTTTTTTATPTPRLTMTPINKKKK